MFLSSDTMSDFPLELPYVKNNFTEMTLVEIERRG